ncbi:MFS transporter [Francisellaceae bacterium CB299]
MLKTRYQKLVFTLIILTGICAGFDIGVISGTLPIIKTELSLNLIQLSEIAGIVFFGALLSKLVSGFLMDILSRKNVITLGAFLFTVSMVLMMLSNTYVTLMLSRLLQGISIGFLLTVIPIYIAETSMPKFRGRAMGIFQLSLVSGIFIANLLASLFVHDYGWRAIFGLAIPFSVVLFVISVIAPFSPSWLFLKGRNELAISTGRGLSLSVDNFSVTNCKTGAFNFIKVFFDKKYFIPILFVSFLAVLNGFVGINVFISYAPSIFEEVLGCTQCGSGHYGTVLTLINLVATVIGMLLVDVIGRKKLVLGGLFIAFISIILVIYFLTVHNITAMLIMLTLVVFGGAVGPGICIWLILSEVLPTHIRGMGISIALVSKALIESIFISKFLGLTSVYGFAPVFYFMGICMIVFAILVYKFLPEMTNKELL